MECSLWRFWDRKERKLLLARDRYGIKPLYYYQNNQKLVFSSEQKAILEQPSFDRVINKKALFEYLTFSEHFYEPDSYRRYIPFSGRSLCNN